MTPHFSKAEVACRCGCGMLPKQEFMWRLERVRVKYGKPMKVTSGARCPKYNAQVSSTGLSGPHTTGRAVDVALSGQDALQALKIALEAGFTGAGLKQHGPYPGRFLHLDDLPNEPGQPRPHCWSYP